MKLSGFPDGSTILSKAEFFASWFYSNVLWGVIPLLITVVVSSVIGFTVDTHGETRVALTVLALSLCGTHFIGDVGTSSRELKVWHWLGRCAFVFIVAGVVMSVLNVLISSKIKIGTLQEKAGVLTGASALLFFLTLVIAFSAYSLKLRVTSKSYEATTEEDTKSLIHGSKTASSVDGVKL
jgi:hypothetical protein